MDSPAALGPSWPDLALWAFGALQALAVAVGVTVLKRVGLTHDRVERMDVALFGEKGDNGINGDVKALKEWRHKEGNRRHAIHARLYRLELHNDLPPMAPAEEGA